MHRFNFILIFLIFVSEVYSKNVINDYFDYNEPIEEIQHAACKIATKEIEASANATITRQLKGVCTSKELTKKINKMEERILQEIENLKKLFQDNNLIKPEIKSLKLTEDNNDNNRMINDNEITNEEEVNANEPELRIAEIEKFNNTIHKNGYENEFNYYWKINDIKNNFNNDEIISDNFFTSGHLYYIELVPNYLGTKYASFELKTAGFLKQMHRFVILDQNDSKLDISSQVLGIHHNAGRYRISREKIKRFVKNNTLIIKLVLYV